MSEELVPVHVAGLIPTPGGAGVFLSDHGKVMAIFIDESVARPIGMALEGESSPRPLTHDLMGSIFDSFGLSIRKVIINHHEDATYFARLHLEQENELGKSIAEIDARPSDCIALAVLHDIPIFIADHVWADAEDMTWAMKKGEEDAENEET